MTVLFGEKIRNARRSAGLTQRALAQMLGVANTSVSNWEKDLSRPGPDVVQQLCEIFKVEPNYFYGSENAPAGSGKGAVSDEDIKFALFGGDGEITDAMFEEVKKFAAYVKQREAKDKE